MRELEYQLVKDDYKNWIHWNVLRNESKKMKLFTLVIYVAFVVIYVGGSISSAKGNPAAVIPSLGMALIVGAAMFYTTSHHNQERLIWKKSGLKRLEKANNFPVVHLSLGEFGIVMNVPSENTVIMSFPVSWRLRGCFFWRPMTRHGSLLQNLLSAAGKRWMNSWRLWKRR